MPLETLLTNPNPSVPRPRSILSRFANPLSQHARNVFELAVEPEDRFRIYSPGQLVKGHVVLTVLKGFDITHLVVALHGYAKVYKHQIAPGEGLPALESLVQAKGTRGVEYHGNGLASLFQEEQVLCGSGFLKKQVYKFAFEIPFPPRNIPSAIDFERGTVSYMVTATLTRPTTIAPTTTRSAKLKFQDSIDIESMYTSKSRVISLEPVSRRGKVKVVKPSLSLASHTANGAPQLTRNNTQTSTATRSTCSVGHPPLSPAPSDDTVATATTTSTPSSQPLDSELPGQKASPPTSETRSNTTCSSAHTITASTELPRHGALPGDTIPIRVSIVHTKPNVRGVVISTLYRQARVDMHPPIPLANRGKVKRAEYEDVYPRSRTGLGGLYFTHSSPSSVFRMDLSQSSTMMVVDPHTLTAEIKTSIKVPDTAFPTISNVPGGMISFTYHIEVVVDLFGKFGETRFLPRLTSSEPTFTHTSDPGNQLTSDWSNSILDTTQLRRTKSVITFEMSVVVGTKDSSRKQRPIRTPDTQDTNNVTQSPDDEWQDMNGQNEHFGDQFYDPGTGYYSWDDGYQPYDPEYYYDYGQNLPASNVVPPPPDSDEGLDEKGRLQRDERLLLPSRPPEDGDTSGHAAAFVPSAPDLASESISDGIEGGRQDGTITPSISTTSASVGSARSAETIKPDPAAAPPLPSTNDARPTDDKRELERRRLLAEASAPPVEDGDGASRSVPSPLAPTAPALPEDDEYNFQTLNHDDLRPALPQYEQ